MSAKYEGLRKMAGVFEEVGCCWQPCLCLRKMAIIRCERGWQPCLCLRKMAIIRCERKGVKYDVALMGAML